ncbi:MAG: hypothetical protein HRT88_01355, partial [Lentisphaeraceae bacterium]|nr:hypothetical protein [Lentisphaeraceae bacterium]
ESPIATFSVCDLSCSKSHSRRTAGGPTESLFEIKEGEHYEVGGTFEFKLEEESLNTPSHLETIGDYITYELWDLDGIDEKITSGTGASFSHTFASADEGDAVVWWYFDGNGDQEWNYILDEAGTESKEFRIQELTTIYLTAQKSNLLPTLTIAKIKNWYKKNADQALRKDSATDWRATIKFDVSANDPFEFKASTSRPDPVRDLADVGLHDNVMNCHDVIFVDTCDVALGVSRPANHAGAVIDWTDSASGAYGDAVGVHEYGHWQGIYHPGHQVRHIMYIDGYPTCVEILNNNQATIFEE